MKCFLFGHDYQPKQKFRCFLLNNNDHIIGVAVSHQGYECTRCGKRHVVELEPATQIRAEAMLWQNHMPFDTTFQKQVADWVLETQSDYVERPDVVQDAKGLHLVVNK